MSERDYVTYDEGSEPPPGGHVLVGRCRWVRVGDRWRPAATVGRGFWSWAELRSSAVRPTSRPVAGGVVVEPVVRPVFSAGRAAALRRVRDV